MDKRLMPIPVIVIGTKADKVKALHSMGYSTDSVEDVLEKVKSEGLCRNGGKMPSCIKAVVATGLPPPRQGGHVPMTPDGQPLPAPQPMGVDDLIKQTISALRDSPAAAYLDAFIW
jgi:hypothetical protein